MTGRLLVLWGPVVLVAAGITALSHMSRPPRPSAVPDWLLHGAEFAALGVAVGRALAGGLGRQLTARTALWTLALGTAFAVGDEFHQTFVPGRDASGRDVVADAAGVGAGAALVALAGLKRVAPRSIQAPLPVTLITGPHCPLCDAARASLRGLAARLPLAVEECSAADDPRWAVYRDEVPVILVAGHKVSKGKVDDARLEASLVARAGDRT